MALLVQKFGGSSLGDVDHIRQVATRVTQALDGGDQVVVTVSAMGSETDELIALTPRVSRSPRPRELDMLVTSAERKAAALVCLALEDRGVRAQSFSGQQAGIVTDDHHTEASILEVRPDRIIRALEHGIVPVIGGSQGASSAEDDTFLGRGGSDTTAVALAAALQADRCELYTDVEGIFTADPRLVTDARLLDHLSHEQMLAMCLAGCPKPSTRAIELAGARDVAVLVRAADGPGPGTLIDGCPGGCADLRAIVTAPGPPGAPGRVSVIAAGAGDDNALQAQAERALTDCPAAGPLEVVSPLWLAWEVASGALREAAQALHTALVTEGQAALAGSAGGDED